METSTTVIEKYTIPRYVEWQITAKCNLNCIHCSSAGRTPQTDLSTRAAMSLVYELLDAGIKSITLSGGEPLLHDDWEMITGVLKENSVSVQMISNGQQLGDDAARKLKRLGVNFVWLSLDGPEQAHNTIRRHRRAYNRVMDAATRLEQAEVPYGFMTTLLTINYDQLPELSEIIQERSSALWQIWLGNKCNIAPIWLKPSQIRQVIEQLPQLRARTPQLIIGDNIGYSSVLETLRTPGFIDYCDTTSFSGCYGANTIMGIKNDGALKGCLSMPDSDPTVPFSPSLSLSERYREAAMRHRKGLEMAVTQCRGCARVHQCNGGCPAWALSNNAQGDARFCRKAPSQHPLRSAAISASFATLCTLSASQYRTATPVTDDSVTVDAVPLANSASPRKA